MCRVRSVARNVLRATCGAQDAVRPAREPEASARQRWAEGPAASRRVSALWCVFVWVASDGAQGVACEAWGAECSCVKCCALCGAVGARAGSECEAAAGWAARRSRPAVAFRLCVCACDEQTAAVSRCGRLRAEGAQCVARWRAARRTVRSAREPEVRYVLRARAWRECAECRERACERVACCKRAVRCERSRVMGAPSAASALASARCVASARRARACGVPQACGVSRAMSRARVLARTVCGGACETRMCAAPVAVACVWRLRDATRVRSR